MESMQDLGTMTPFYLLSPPFLNLHLCHCYPMLVPSCVLGGLGQVTCLFSFTSPHMERNFVQEQYSGLSFRASSTPDCDDLGDETFDF